MENSEREVKYLVFPNYEKFSHVNSTYSDIVNKITYVINNLALCKTSRMKNQSNEWFNGELAEQISKRNKLFKKFKKANEVIYKEAKTQYIIYLKKKENFFLKKARRKYR